MSAVIHRLLHCYYTVILLFSYNVELTLLFVLRYTCELRPSTLVLDGKPLLNDRDFARAFNRLVIRLSSFKAEESMVTITPEFAAHVHAQHVRKDISRKLTGDRTKILMLAMPLVCRDLMLEEVLLHSYYTVITRCTNRFLFITLLLHCYYTVITRYTNRFLA